MSALGANRTRMTSCRKSECATWDDGAAILSIRPIPVTTIQDRSRDLSSSTVEAAQQRLLLPSLPGARTRAARSLAAPGAGSVLSRKAALAVGSLGTRRHAHRDGTVG